jgi:hypothetical protein
MDSQKRKKLQARKRRKYVNLKKHQHPNANFGQLWKEANERYPD